MQELSEVIEGGGEGHGGEEGDVNMAQLDGLAYLLYTSGTFITVFSLLFIRHEL